MVNKKLPTSLNDGFKRANGEYLTWTSDDNWYDETAVENLVNFLDNNPKIDMVSSNYRLVENEKIQDNIITKTDAEALINGNTIGACFLYRRSIAKVVGEYDPSMFLVEDYDYWLRILLKGKIGHLNKILYNYRLHKNSLSNTRRLEIKYKELLLKQKYYNEISFAFPECTLNELKRFVNYSKAIDNLINKIQKYFSLKPIYIYGSGFLCYLILKKIDNLKKNKIVISGIFDTSAKNGEFYKYGYCIKYLQQNNIAKNSVIVIASDKYRSEISNNIKKFMADQNVNIKVIELDFE